ncbi:MAG: hypothetical protein Q9207_008379 [Kuettlingeria erythrocarpa]
MSPFNAIDSGTSAVQHVQSQPGASLTSPKHSLLTIPAEVRVTILRFVLVVNDRVIPFPHHMDYPHTIKGYGRLPQVSFLQTNRQIYNEAAEILYGENVWVMNITSLALVDDSNPFIEDLERDWKTPLFWESKGPLINHAVTAFTQHDVHPLHLFYISEWARKKCVGADDERAHMRQRVNDYRELFQVRTWVAKCKILQRCGLKTLTASFENCCFPCGVGRRRALDFISTTLRAAQGLTLMPHPVSLPLWRPTEVTIVGLKSKEERLLFEGPEKWTILEGGSDDDEAEGYGCD